MIRLFDSELKVMEALWEEGDLPAKELSHKMYQSVGWSRTTTYTIIKKLVDKGAVQRTDPGFVCSALISREEARTTEVNVLIDRMFDGSAGLLINTLLQSNNITEEMARELLDMVEQAENRSELDEGEQEL